VAIKKSDLYSSLWASCDELRGGMPKLRNLDSCCPTLRRDGRVANESQIKRLDGRDKPTATPRVGRGQRELVLDRDDDKQLRSSDSKTFAQSTLVLDSSRSRSPAIFLQSAEGSASKSDSKSVAYEFRTKSA
jgi:hypothetical protein